MFWAVIVGRRVASLVSPRQVEEWSALFGDSAKLRVGYPRWLSPFLQKGVIAITLGRTVYVSERMLQKGERELNRTLRHELAHVRQVARLGLVRFLYRYLREYVSLRRGGMKSFEAYEAISFEREARAAEDE